jgi:hypothetical protein
MKIFNIAMFPALLLVLASLFSLQAQTPANPPVDTNAKAASPTPAGQAPDELTKKIAELVHAGKYTEAQQLTTGLLVLYPDDQRLIKAKGLLETLLAAPASATPGNNQPTNNVVSPLPTANTSADQFTGMEKVDYNALIELGRQAQQTTDLEQQKASLKQFMGQSAVFLQKHPTEMLLWQLRVASAISLNDPMAGYEAGQKLLAAGGADSSDPNLQRLLAQLKNKGWLDKKGAEDAQEYIRLRSLELRLVYGPWSTGHISVHMKATMTVTVSGLGDMKEPVGIRLENGSPKTCRLDGGATGTFTIKPGEAVDGTYTTRRTVTLLGWSSYEVPCTINGSVVDKTGKDISRVTINNGY